ncbi:hypothetical protein MBRA1_001174 [Malassezia brasiliensis]|uniref:Midasin n=1 Tax=Malassezia brasiliensis TaxID=1821822 RepID=A0AAF0DSE6_9BASI|nr:hypothetical protein MBRA1_001174 [Malassezia brasiliensis]
MASMAPDARASSPSRGLSPSRADTYITHIDLRAFAYAAAASVDEQHAPRIHACMHGDRDVAALLNEAAAHFARGTLDVILAFRAVILELSVRALAHDRIRALHTLSQLLGAFEELFPVVHAALRDTGEGELDLLAQYRLLRAAPDLAVPGTSAALYTIFSSTDADVATRFLALEVYALRERLAPPERDELIARWIGEEAAPLACAPDVRLLPVYEARRIAALWDACATPTRTADGAEPLLLGPADITPPLVLLGGLLVCATHPAPDPSFVETPSLAPHLAQAALHLGLRLPLLITGPAACGKTHFVAYLAQRLRGGQNRPPLLTIQLGDQSGVDGKQLLGSFVSSSTTPGTFEWVEGALTRAVREGVWVLLEDIDKASGDVLSVLAPLLDALGPTKPIGARPVLDLGARGVVEAAPGFALFATRSRRHPFLTSEHWGEVVLEAPTPTDVDAILTHRFPALGALPPGELACVVRGWAAVADAVSAPDAPSGMRRITLRELVKWCARIEAQHPASLLANPLVQESVFLDACDLFFAALSDAAVASTSLSPFTQSLLLTLADALHVSPERARWALEQRVPELVVGTASACRLGRVPLPGSAARAPSASRYALTKPTLTLLERVAEALRHVEPVLLVGETGTGKTSMVQYLASLYATPLTVVNMSQQTESADLLGAYKPLDPKTHAHALHNRWTALFTRTFSERRNAAFLEAERKALVQSKWPRLVKLWQESARMAAEARAAATSGDGEARKKRRVTDTSAEWEAFSADVASFAAMHAGKQRHFVFTFVEGPLVHALRHGHWILLDEINLAAAETLECLAMLLQSKESSVVLTERGDLEPVERHPNFRLFACMNPATDVGKRDLPPAFRARFTELYVPSPDADREALVSIVAQYIGEASVGDRAAVLDVAEWYTAVRKHAQAHELADGCNERPHYSIRTLARALTFAAALVPQYGLRRGLAEGVTMAFGMLLDAKSTDKLYAATEQHLLARARDRRRLAPSFRPPPPSTEHTYVPIGPFWLETGPLPLDAAEEYILTPSVESKLTALARTLITRQSPVLIQGPTSAGKTSAVEYLARRTGHRFVRINNHEHTDVQEYLGAYASDASGRLVYTEGLLVTALRRGDWIVLDELNLAPTDVLEALNRLLDDNRELLIPETGEIVRPHPHFMLFATQNPPGAYAGRKMLSRALRNRFVELHFDDVPETELATILTHRCRIAPSYAAKIVAVFAELQRRRQAERVFENKHAATLRDLFRWGARQAVGYEQLADTGYMLLAERARSVRDRDTIRAVIEEVMRVRIDPERLYTLDTQSTVVAQIGEARARALRVAAEAQHIVWTAAMRRLVCLAAVALAHNEPVLLVGETGAGKTSVCDILAAAYERPLHSFSCHQNTDSADLLGGQRPIRDRAARVAEARSAAAAAGVEGVDDVPLEALLATVLALPASEARDVALERVAQAQALFVWTDGPLVDAMRCGDHMLLDEVSLADDSVLERLNSVLEKERTLVLAEKPGQVDDVAIAAAPGFQILATMNPGGDYGKKELSPALRNRFTEIYVPAVDAHADLAAILEAQWPVDAPELRALTEPMLAFVAFVAHQLGGAEHTGLGVRDLLSWAAFVCAMHSAHILTPPDAFAQGAALVVIDGLGALPSTAAMSAAGLAQLRARCWAEAARLIAPAQLTTDGWYEVRDTPTHLYVGPYALAKEPRGAAAANVPFALRAPTTAENAMRVLRACAVPRRSVLLEGSPGAGKTSLIASLAAMTGHELTRINLSEQTELVDLFGAELPVEGGRPGEFAWRPAAFLEAMQAGHWVLLDEMNLASQTVLEGLNACLDHRGTVFVPEIGREFTRHPAFRIFAAQNPQHQGGARKGLPKSLLNRFTKVHVAELNAEDALAICTELFPAVPHATLAKMVAFNDALQTATVRHEIGSAGAPWEFNLRDLLRWLTLMQAPLGTPSAHDPAASFAALYARRFRTPEDRARVAALFVQHMGAGDAARLLDAPRALLDAQHALLGHTWLARGRTPLPARAASLALPPTQLACLEAAADAVRLGWLTIVVGGAGAGKSAFVHLLADLSGAPLDTVRLSGASDTMDLLGSFEQHDTRHAQHVHAEAVRAAVRAAHRRRACAPGGGEIVAALTAADAALAHGDLRAALASCAALPADLWSDSERTALHAAHDLVDVRPQAGQFAWVDGPLVRAAEQGHWLLLEDANLCSASVLDRLNSLFEPHGTLMLSERGMVDGAIPELRAHADFRVFMTVDPRHGELSRAMRNRGLEVFLDAPELARLAPMARCPPWLARDSVMHAAVQAHAMRRGHVDAGGRTAEDVAPLVPRVVDGALTPVAHVLDWLPRDAARALVLAAQTLTPSAMRALGPALDAAQQTCIATALRGVSDATAERDAALVDAAYPPALVHTLLAPDARRLGIPSGDVGARIALRVRAVLLQHALDALDDTGDTVLARAKRQAADLDPLLAALPTLLGALLALALRATRAPVDDAETHGALGTLLDAAHFLFEATHAEHADFSLVHVVLRTVRAALRDVRTADTARVDAILRAMQAPRTCTGGAAMQAIWARTLPAVPVRVLPALGTLAHAAHAAGDAARARTAVELLATLHLADPAWSDAQQSELVRLATQLAPELGTPPPPRAFTWVAAALPVVLWMLTVHPATDVPRAARLTALLSLATAHGVPPVALVGAQLQRWAPATAVASAPTTCAHALHALWPHGGVAPLLRAVLLHTVADAVQTERVSLFAWPAYVDELAELRTAVSIAAAPVETPRDASLRALLLAFAAWLTLCLADAVRAAAPEAAALADDLAAAAEAREAARLAETLAAAADTLPVALPLTGALRGWLDAVRTAVMPASTSLHALGTAWLALAMQTLALYVPSVPLDPVAEAHAQRAYAASRVAHLERTHAIEASREQLLTGNAHNPVLDTLHAELQRALAQRAHAGRTHVARTPDAARLARLHTELVAFATQVMAPTRIEAVLASLAARADRAVDQAESVQASLASFAQRLARQYTAEMDLVAPVLVALDAARIGLGVCLSARPAGRTHAAVAAAAQFPSVAAAAAVPTCAATNVDELVASLAACAYTVHVHGSTDRTQVASLYASLYAVWAHERAQAEDAEAAAAQLYTYRGQDDADDEAARLAEQRRLFPVYDDVLEEEGAPPPPRKSKRTLDDARIDQVYRLHSALFAAEAPPDGALAIDVTQAWAAARAALVCRGAQTRAPLPPALDATSAALQLELLTQRTAPRTTRANFYHDADPAALAELAPILVRLSERVAVLHATYPEHVQLAQLHARCERVAQLGMDSPVARALAAVEQLLTHVDDWETYASSETSLRDAAAELTALVVAWRKRELHAWQHLLDDEAAAEEARVAPLFFSLYESVVHAAVDDEAGMRTLVGLLDTYVRTSPLGQLAVRLRLLRTMVPLAPTAALGATLRNVAQYYAQFLAAAHEHLDTARRALEREVRDYVQLATWRDVNVYALRQSAQKTHTYLHRTLRKFRSALQEPAGEVLARAAEARPPVAVRTLLGAGDEAWAALRTLPDATPVPRTASAPAHLRDAVRTVRNLHARNASHLFPRVHATHLAAAVRELGTDILESADALAAQTPALATEANAKQIKSLAAQKRRAFADLLKELRRLGLSPHVSVERLAALRDAVRMYSAPALPPSDALATDAVDSYAAALLAQLTRVRAAVHAPQGDASPADLQRALGSIEHGAEVAARVRARLATAAVHAASADAVCGRLATLHAAPAVVAIDGPDAWAAHACAVRVAADVLTDVRNKAPAVAQASPMPTDASCASLAPLLSEAAPLAARLAAVADAVRDTGLQMCTHEEGALLTTSAALVRDCGAALAALEKEAPALAALTAPARAYLATLALPPPPAMAPAQAEAHETDDVCNAVLVVAQELHALPPPPAELVDRVLVDEVARLADVERVLRPAHMLARFRTVPATRVCVQAVYPFVATYARWVFAHAHHLSLLYRALARLELVLCTVTTTLATRGFCTPPEEDEQTNEADEKGEQLEGGTGLGDGSGAKDISDTLQDDEQMEELQQEPGAEPDEGGTEGEDHARETDQLDHGDAHSVDGDKDDDADDGEEGEEQDIEDEVGDVDPLDPDAVDEKMWGNDDAPDETQGESEAQGGAQDDREHAAEHSEGRDDPAGAEAQDDHEDEAGEPEAEPEMQEMPEKQQGLGREMDEEANEQEMQLDDLDMDHGEQDEESASDADADDDDDDGNDADNRRDVSGDEQDAMDEIETDHKAEHGGEAEPEADEGAEPAEPAEVSGDAKEGEPDDVQSEQGEGEEEQPGVDHGAKDEGDGEDMDTEPERKEHAGEQTKDVPQDPLDTLASDRPEGANEPQQAEALEAQPDVPPRRGAPPPPRTEQRNLSDLAEMNTDADGAGDNAGGAAGAQERAVGGAGDAGQSAPEQGGAAQAHGADAPDAPADADAEERVNPTQSLGDSLEQFRRDVAAIREARDAAPQTRDEAMPEAGDVEHVAHDDDADTQALGVASEQQAQAMRQLSLDEDTEAPPAPTADDTEDAPYEEAPARDDDAHDPRGAAPRASERTHGAESGALSRADVERTVQGEELAEEETHDPLPDEERAEADHAAEAALTAFRAGEGDAAHAAELWRAYATLTTDLAFALCEQLRLILVPSLATRLNGDFRTGKRLNLRKIIPYIASDFAKDKIWLRRTKPSAREYQVLLSIDDSKSMAEGRNIHLAYQTLALVTGAMMRLEVGDVAVCRFGRDVEMLHEFGAASFSDAHGGQILSKLRFDQTSTDVHALLSSTLQVLRTARATRASATGSELWQLQIIISDGVCQDHERLRAQIRRAMAERVMLVFVVVDAADDDEKPSRSSILTMNQVSYHTDAAGKLQLQMQRYIDTFPFDSYVIVRDVQALPGVLASTLRQWAEKIRDA